MRTGITGATGLIGRTLSRELITRGHEVVAITRRDGLPSGLPRGAEVVRWNPETPEGGGAALDEGIAGLDALVHLAGEPVGKRWSAVRKRRIRESRVEGTRILVAALARSKNPPDRFLAASAIGYYGPRGDEVLDEEASSGSDFLAEVCQEWEAAASSARGRARDSGIETASLRIGVVLSREGGALAAMLPPFRLGAGGRLGTGRQWMAWIHIADAAAAIVQLLEAPAGSLAQAYNLTAPEPARNADFTKTLGRVLRRPTVFPAPAFAMRLALGEMADSLLLSGQRVIPRRLLAAGFGFRFPKLEPALTDLLTPR